MTDAYYTHSRRLVEAIADWERAHGSIIILSEDEAPSLVAALQRAVRENPYCSARAAISAVEPQQPIAVYEEPHRTFIDYADHVRVKGTDVRYMVLVSSVFDDGEYVSPGTPLGVFPNFVATHETIAARYNQMMRAVRQDENDPTSVYSLYYGDNTETDSFLVLELIALGGI